MKIVFMGTPEFAVPCLDVLIKNYDVQAVFTQPDRPKGRGKKLAMSAIKERALIDNIRVYQPEKIRKSDDINILKSIAPDVIVVVAYGQILSQEILDIPKLGCINVHASLLPKLRGAAPINWSIVNGDKTTGVTTMYMAKGIDTGDMIQKMTVDITENMTAGDLHDLLSDKGSEVIISTIEALKNGSAVRTVQEDAESTHAPMMNKEMAIIDWHKTAQQVHDLIRGFNPWPIATSTLAGEKLKVFVTRMTSIERDGKCGEIVSVGKEGLYVNCSDRQLLIKEIQMPNKKRMTIEQYILGNSIEKHTQLGE